MEYQVLITRVENGYRAEVPALPGCLSQGATEKEALSRIRESIQRYVQAFRGGSSPLNRLKLRKIKIKPSRPRGGRIPAPEPDPILQLSGLGKEIWEGIDPDEYVRRERESWD